jgi:hypothetical protein
MMLVLALAAAPSQAEKEVAVLEKKAFLDLVYVTKLPTRGEYFTAEAVQKVAPYTRVLLALTEKDLGERDIYPLLALSAGLVERKEQREYGVKHFGKVAHPTIKLSWGVCLFDAKEASPEIVAHLRAALETKGQAERLSQMLGPHFEDFKERVKEHKAAKPMTEGDLRPALLRTIAAYPRAFPSTLKKSTERAALIRREELDGLIDLGSFRCNLARRSFTYSPGGYWGPRYADGVINGEFILNEKSEWIGRLKGMIRK